MIAILVVVALIVYASLYPWSFQANAHADVGVLFRSFPSFTRRVIVDAMANVLFYVPLGLTVFLHVRTALGRTAAFLLAIGAAFTLSLTLEYVQLFQRARHASSLDLVTNTAGGAVGAALAGAWARLRVRMPSYGALLLWASWIVSLTFPLIPLLSPYLIRQKLFGFLAFSLPVLLGFALQWFIAGVLLTRGHVRLLGATLLLIPAQLFFSGTQPTLGMFAGALAGCVLALLPMRPRSAAGVAIALLIAWQVAPGASAAPERFAWIPFSDAMEASRGGAVGMVLGKAFTSAGVIAILGRAGAGLAVATTVVVALLGATEVAQLWIPGRTPATTDPVVALLAAAVLARSKGRV